MRLSQEAQQSLSRQIMTIAVDNQRLVLSELKGRSAAVELYEFCWTLPVALTCGMGSWPRLAYDDCLDITRRCANVFVTRVYGSAEILDEDEAEQRKLRYSALLFEAMLFLRAMDETDTIAEGVDVYLNDHARGDIAEVDGVEQALGLIMASSFERLGAMMDGPYTEKNPLGLRERVSTQDRVPA